MSESTRRTAGGGPVAALAAPGALLLVLSGSTRNGWLVLLAALVFGLLAAALVLRPRLGGLGVEVRLPPRAVAGDVVIASVVVTNQGSRPTPAATLSLHAAGLQSATVAVPALLPQACASSGVAMTTYARVELSHITTLVRSAAPFGIVAVTTRSEAPTSLLVRPAPGHPMQRLPAGSGGGSEHSRPGPGVDVQGIREWRHGDSARRLHVRSTARHGRPIVLDRHDNLATGLAVVVGSGGGSTGTGDQPHPLWEPMISVVASALAEAGREGDRIAAVTTRMNPTTGPALADLPGGSSAEEALDWCARLTSPSAPSGEAVRRAAAAIGSGVVVVADLYWSTDAPWWAECVAAADAVGVELRVLHPFADRTDALCLHSAHSDTADAAAAGVRR